MVSETDGISIVQKKQHIGGHDISYKHTYLRNYAKKVACCPSASRCSRLHHLKPLRHYLGDLLVLVWQQAQSKRDVVPLSLCLAPGQSCSQLLCELFGMFILSMSCKPKRKKNWSSSIASVFPKSLLCYVPSPQSQAGSE